MSGNQLAVIEQNLRSREVQQTLILSLGLSPEDEKGQQEAFQYVNSVLEQVKKTEGDKYGDLTLCTPQSICRAMIDAAKLRVTIDARQQAHIIKRGTQAQLQIGFRGYISKISEYYKDADFTAEAIFNGDSLVITDEGGFQTYELKKAAAFADKWDNMIGVLVCLSYTKGGQRFQKITTVSKDDLVKIRGKAITDSIWVQWPIEKAKAAAIKRACKIQFADVMGLQEIINYDNEANFDLSKQPATPVRRSIVDNINESINGVVLDHVSLQEHGDSDQTVIQEQQILPPPAPEMPDILSQAFMEAKKGEKHFIDWVAKQDEDKKEIIRTRRRELSHEAKIADLNNNNAPPV